MNRIHRPSFAPAARAVAAVLSLACVTLTSAACTTSYRMNAGMTAAYPPDKKSCDEAAIVLLKNDEKSDEWDEIVPKLRRDCGASSGGECGFLGEMYLSGCGVPRDPQLAAAYLFKACNLGSHASCGELGVLYDRGLGVPENPPRAVELWSIACAKGDRDSCRTAGVALANGAAGVPRDPERAKALIARACKAGDDVACKLQVK